MLAVIRATSDLERIGDEASKIARNALLLSENSGGIRGLVEVRGPARRQAPLTARREEEEQQQQQQGAGPQ